MHRIYCSAVIFIQNMNTSSGIVYDQNIFSCSEQWGRFKATYNVNESFVH